MRGGEVQNPVTEAPRGFDELAPRIVADDSVDEQPALLLESSDRARSSGAENSGEVFGGRGVPDRCETPLDIRDATTPVAFLDHSHASLSHATGARAKSEWTGLRQILGKLGKDLRLSAGSDDAR